MSGERSRQVYRPLPEVPELRFLHMLTARRALAHVLSPHRHADLEISFLKRGWLRYCVDGVWEDLLGGQVIVAWPGEPHGAGHGMFPPCTLYSLQVALDSTAESEGGFLGLPEAEGDALRERLRRLRSAGDPPHRRFLAPADLGPALDAILDAIESRQALTSLRVRALLVRVLIDVIDAGEAAATQRTSPLVEHAVAFMNAHLEEPLSLSELADSLSCSVSHLKARFSRELGVPPASYHTILRVGEAAARLPAAPSITSVALRLGFTSGQQFARVFKKVTGLSPRDYLLAADPALTELSSAPLRDP